MTGKRLVVREGVTEKGVGRQGGLMDRELTSFKGSQTGQGCLRDSYINRCL